MSPFGNAILNRKVGEELTFTINEREYNYTITSITAASI